MLSSFIETGRSVLQKMSLSRQAIDDNRPTSHGGINAHKTVQQPKCPQNVVDGVASTTSNHSPILNNDVRFGPDAGLHVHQEDFDVPTIHNLTRQGTLREPPTTNMDRFKYYIESFHYPVHVSREPTMFRVDVPRNIEWHIQLRHFFVDLDQQLQELEHYLSSSSSSANKDSMDDNTNLTDTAALANWTSYEIPTLEFGPPIGFDLIDPAGIDRFTPLRCCLRKVFSQRSAKGDGKQLTGRWLVVAYVYASTLEAVFNMDVKTLLSTGCSGTVTAAHGTGSCSGAGSSAHYNVDTMLALRAQSWDPHNCIRSGDGPATGTFYQLERRKKLASQFYIYRYGGGGGITTSTTTSMTSTPTVVEIEDKAVDTTITSTTTTTKKTDIVEGTETGNAEDETEMVPTVYYDPYLRRCRPGETKIDAVPIGVPIPQELEDRCHRIDRLWPALMTGQYTPPKAMTYLDDLEWNWIRQLAQYFYRVRWTYV